MKNSDQVSIHTSSNSTEIKTTHQNLKRIKMTTGDSNKSELMNTDLPRTLNSLKSFMKVLNDSTKLEKHKLTPKLKCERVLVKMQKKDIKVDLFNFIQCNPLKEPLSLGKRNSKDGMFDFELFPITASYMQQKKFSISAMQEFLKHRELMSIICKRKRGQQKKARRNDEKCKKIFKKIMKHLLKAFISANVNRVKKLSAFCKEKEFYKYYFGHLKEDISVFYDPLKKRFCNSKYKSICTNYLAELKKSHQFVADLNSFCENKIIYSALKGYSHKMLFRFKHNRNFLTNMEKSKSKFEWVKFELVTAVLYFLFTFKTASFKVKS